MSSCASIARVMASSGAPGAAAKRSALSMNGCSNSVGTVACQAAAVALNCSCCGRSCSSCCSSTKAMVFATSSRREISGALSSRLRSSSPSCANAASARAASR
ncbi:hypothetical protein D3C81_1731430 [compost metagenome]